VLVVPGALERWRSVLATISSFSSAFEGNSAATTAAAAAAASEQKAKPKNKRRDFG
jgi:hypothetical protein